MYGPESLGILSPQYYPVLGTLGRRFLNVHGSPNYLHSGICATQRRFSRLVTIGGATLGQATDIGPGQIDKTKLLVSWGRNPENSAINQGVPFWRLNTMEKGMKVIDIRPMQDALASKADIWVPVRPGTDCALALALLNEIIENGLFDQEFVAKWCSGFNELANHIKEYTAQWASLITGISKELIERVARLMGTVKPMAIDIGNGIGDQQKDGHWAVACVCLIEAITGNLGIAGGGGAGLVLPEPLIRLNRIDLLSDRLPPSVEDIENNWMPGVSKLVAPETPRWFQMMATQESGPTAAYNKALQSVLTEDPYPLRCVFAQATNPLSATRQPALIAEALRTLDFFVAMDTEWNSSCDFADVVLPACTLYESSDQIAVKNGIDGTFIGINQVVQEPVGESRSDWRFYLDLAVEMGYGRDFWNGDLDEMLRQQLEGTGIALEELREKGFLFRTRGNDVEASEPEYQNYSKLFAHLPHGKVQCFNELIGGKPDADGTGTLDWLPVYSGPVESVSSTPEIAREYPLIFSDVHAHRLCNHSYFHRIPYLEELQSIPWVAINPATASKNGIADGDWMFVESPHGKILLVARYFEGIAPDVLMSKRGWGADKYLNSLHVEVNALYDCDKSNFDKFHSAMGKQTLVKIKKAGKTTVCEESHPVAHSTRIPAMLDAMHALNQCEGDYSDKNASAKLHAFYIDTRRCIKCWACEVACKQWHGIKPYTPSRRKVEEVSCGQFPFANRAFLSLSCMHCKKPACVKACSMGAIRKRDEDGIVVVDSKRCVGCGACRESCPYKVPSLVSIKGSGQSNSMVMDKCDACISLRRDGEAHPRCVTTCPTQALHFGAMSEMSALAAGRNGFRGSVPIVGVACRPSEVWA